jgi:hypothetical protein
MPQQGLAEAVEKLARAGKQVGMSIDDMIQILDAGVTVETLVDLIDSLQAYSSGDSLEW